MKRKSVVYAVLALVLAAIVAAGYQWQTTRPMPVKMVQVELNVPVRIFGLGTVEARVVSLVGFEVSAALVELHADQGDLVKKGDVLAKLHTAEQEAKLNIAQTAVQSAKAQHGKAQAALARAEAVLLQRKAADSRQKELVKRKLTSDQTAEEATRDAGVAAADVEVARSEVEVARIQMDSAASQLALEQTLLDHHKLMAPFDAIIVNRRQELGAVIRAGDPIFTLVEPDTVWVKAHVDEALAGDIAIGQLAEVKLRSRPQTTLKAKVERIDIESDRVSEERIVYVKCEQCPATFNLGEQAEVFITVATLEKALLVPEIEVAKFNGHTGETWVVENGALARRTLTFGHRTEDARLEVLGGLEDGARIALGIPATARVGRFVSVAEDQPK